MQYLGIFLRGLRRPGKASIRYQTSGQVSEPRIFLLRSRKFYR